MFDCERIRRFDFFTRCVLAIGALALVLNTLVSPLRYDLAGATMSVAGILVMLGVAYIYARIRPDELLGKSAIAAADLMAFVMILGPLSYAVNATSVPLVTEQIVQLDRMLGFDWGGYKRAVNQVPILHWGLWLAYISFVPQMVLILGALLVTRRFAMARVLLNTFALCALVTILVAWQWPVPDAEFAHMGRYIPKLDEGSTTAEVARSHFFALRSGELTLVPLPKVEGILQFPSYHTMCGILYAACGSVFVWLRWPLVIWNGMMIAATPNTGAHYVTDTLTGFVLAIAVLGLALGYTQRQQVFARLSAWFGGSATTCSGTVASAPRPLL